MGKEQKTNAMRILDRKGISYEILTYPCEKFIDGIDVARKTGVPIEQSYKTLVLRGKSGGHYVLVLPVDREVDLKKAARAVCEKSVEMIPVREIPAVTGYVRGGCSPLGMKKEFPVFVEESARFLRKIYVSGGRIGTTIALRPDDLLSATDGAYADFAAGEGRGGSREDSPHG